MSAKFYIVSPSGMVVSVAYDIDTAKAAAERRRAQTKGHYTIERRETVWTTQTLGEAIAEEESR